MINLNFFRAVYYISLSAFFSFNAQATSYFEGSINGNTGSSFSVNGIEMGSTLISKKGGKGEINGQTMRMSFNKNLAFDDGSCQRLAGQQKVNKLWAAVSGDDEWLDKLTKPLREIPLLHNAVFFHKSSQYKGLIALVDSDDKVFGFSGVKLYSNITPVDLVPKVIDKFGAASSTVDVGAANTGIQNYMYVYGEHEILPMYSSMYIMSILNELISSRGATDVLSKLEAKGAKLIDSSLLLIELSSERLHHTTLRFTALTNLKEMNARKIRS